MQFFDLVLPTFVLVLEDRLHQPARLIPEIVVADIHPALVEVDIHNVGADRIEEMPVMRDDNHRTGEIEQKIFQPVDRPDIEVVGRLVEQQDVRLPEQSLCQQHLDLFPAFQLAHRDAVQLGGDAKPLQQAPGIRFGLPAVHLGELPFQFGGKLPVRIRKVRLFIERILLFHHLIKPRVAHDDRINHRVGVILELVLFEH